MVLVKKAQSSVYSISSRASASLMMLIGFFTVIFAALPEIVIPNVSARSGYVNEVLPLPGGGVANAGGDVDTTAHPYSGNLCNPSGDAFASSCGSCAGSGCDCGSCACGDGDGGDSCGE